MWPITLDLGPNGSLPATTTYNPQTRHLLDLYVSNIQFLHHTIFSRTRLLTSAPSSGQDPAGYIFISGAPRRPLTETSTTTAVMEFMTNLQSGLDEQKPSLFGIC
jgi:hypothetical protein